MSFTHHIHNIKFFCTHPVGYDCKCHILGSHSGFYDISPLKAPQAIFHQGTFRLKIHSITGHCGVIQTTGHGFIVFYALEMCYYNANIDYIFNILFFYFEMYIYGIFLK